MDWYLVKEDLGSSLLQDRKWNSGLYIRGRLRPVVTSEAKERDLGVRVGARSKVDTTCSLENQAKFDYSPFPGA